MSQSKPKKVLVIGSGPIVIGQSAEFDYSGTQACKSLREEGIEVVLVNSNPATIQTDKEIADRVYIEPLSVEFLDRIIDKERPDAILATVGGQTALNLVLELSKKGILDRFNVKLIGTGLEAIEKAEDRHLFNEVMKSISIPILPGLAVHNYQEAYDFAEKIGYPVILRPAFTLGGSGGGIAYNKQELKELLDLGFRLSSAHEVLIEKSVIGWGEFEYEVVRDRFDNAIIICNMENFDPMGIHTGESIVVAPSQTLSDKDHQMLRDAALKIVREIGIIGSCNVQFAVNQKTSEFTVIEINPRLSRSSALASKATGYPIARVATKISLGYAIHEIKNAITGTTAAFEPTLDYCVLKIPKWPFEKFLNADRRISTQMKSTGEAMAIGRTFEEALMKGLRSLEVKVPDNLKPEENLMPPTDLRIFAIFDLLRNGKTIQEINSITKINLWFLDRLKYIISVEKKIKSLELSKEILIEAKRSGFSDAQIGKLKDLTENEVRSIRKKYSIVPTYKIVDSCAGEFEAKTPYYYSTYEFENEAIPLTGRKILIIGSGPIRIGQGIEFDYCCCHAAFALRSMTIKSIIINNNPETVSTDFDTSDRLYFEPLTFEDVMNLIDNEKPDGVMLQFGGQTSINLAEKLSEAGVPILGTQFYGIDVASDREKFRELANKIGILQPKNGTVTNEKDALKVAKDIGYPVVVRPSYVIAGRGMQIISNEEELKKFIGEAVSLSNKKPVLIDKYIDSAIECEVDAISDGKNLFIPGIMEHVEYAGVHSGDANIVIPSINLEPEIKKKIEEQTIKISNALGVVGFINIQYAVKGNDIYVIEANPRASRTVPFLSKAISIPLVSIATKACLGVSISAPLKKLNHFSVKGVVFPFLKLKGADIALGPEMKSTGETMGIGKTFETAYFKALLSSGFTVPKRAGTVGALLSLRDQDKGMAFSLSELLEELGFMVFATPGTAKYIPNAVIVHKIGKGAGETEVLDLLNGGKISLVINTPKKGSDSQTDGFKIRRMSIEKGIACMTNVRTAIEFLKALKATKEDEIEILELEEYSELRS